MIVKPLARFPLPCRQDEEGKSGRQGAGEGHVGDVVARLHEKAGGSAEDERGQEPFAAAEEPAADMVDEEDGQKSHGRSGETGGKFVLAENGHRERAQPVMERRFVEELDIVEHRGDEVAAFEHLARYLRIASLIGIDEGNPAQELEKGDAENEQEDGEVLLFGGLLIGEKMR